jgi:amino acid transporter
MELEECPFSSNKAKCDFGDDNRVGISKCLKCMHHRKMDFLVRIAHFNIYATLLNLGFISFNALMEIKIGSSFIEILSYSFITGIIVFGSTILFGLRDIKKQDDIEKKREVKFEDDLNVYLLAIISFGALIYIFFYTIKILNIFNLHMEFIISFFGALIVSVLIFIVLGYKYKKIEGELKKIFIDLNVLPEK